jgi:hypothetical protein
MRMAVPARLFAAGGAAGLLLAPLGARLNPRPPLRLPYADLRERDLTRASLAGADLHGARLRLSCLAHADLRGADLRGADLFNGSLAWADLRGARLDGADLRCVLLTHTRLRGASLRGARLQRATLDEAGLEGADLTGAVYDDLTSGVAPEVLESLGARRVLSGRRDFREENSPVRVVAVDTPRYTPSNPRRLWRESQFRVRLQATSNP